MDLPKHRTKYVLYDPTTPELCDREYTGDETVPVIHGFAFADTDLACSYLQKIRNYQLIRNPDERERIFVEILGLDPISKSDPKKSERSETTDDKEGEEGESEAGDVDPEYERLTDLRDRIREHLARKKKSISKMRSLASEAGIPDAEGLDYEALIEKLEEASR